MTNYLYMSSHVFGLYLPTLLCSSGYEHQNNNLVSAETAHQTNP